MAWGNGTEAIHLALLAFGIGPGDEVITVSHTAIATVSAIQMCGAVPVFVDIHPTFYTMDPAHVEKAVTKNTKAIMPVHLYGQVSDMAPLMACAKQNDLYLIEDCAQAHGAIYHKKRVGSLGHAGTFSFYPSKNLGCLGDGGAITTNSSKIRDRIISLRQYGWDNNRISCQRGFNSRLDELQAAILRIKLNYLEESNSKRIKTANLYNELIHGSNTILPTALKETTHVYHQYVIRCNKKKVRDDLMYSMGEKQIQVAIHYPVPAHLQPFYAKAGNDCQPLPVTEKTAQTIISLPMFPELSNEDIEKTADGINSFFT